MKVLTCLALVVILEVVAINCQGNANQFVDEILNNINNEKKQEFFNARFGNFDKGHKSGVYRLQCNNGRLTRLDGVSRHGDAQLNDEGNNVYTFQMTIQVNQVTASCDGYARALIAKIRTGVNVHFDGLRLTLTARANLNDQTVQILRSDISERWGFSIRTNKILEFFANLMKGKIERTIIDTINNQLSKLIQQKAREIDLSKIISS